MKTNLLILASLSLASVVGCAYRSPEMYRDDTTPLAPDHFLHDMFVHTRGLGEKDLRLALRLGEANGVQLPLAEVALRDLAAGLGVPHTTSTVKE